MSGKDKQDEVDFIAGRLVDKLWQGDESRRGIAHQAASIALAAMQDYTATRYVETADQFDGPSLMTAWVRGEMLREARASVALDKGDGQTFSVEDESVEKVAAAFDAGEKHVTEQPPSNEPITEDFGPVPEPPRLRTVPWSETKAKMQAAYAEEQARVAAMSAEERAAHEADKQRRRQALDELIQTSEELGLYDRDEAWGPSTRDLTHPGEVIPASPAVLAAGDALRDSEKPPGE